MKDKEKQIEEMAISEMIQKYLNYNNITVSHALLPLHIEDMLIRNNYRKIPEDSVVVEKGLLEYWKDKATSTNGLLLKIDGVNGWFPKEFIVKAIERYKSMKDSVVLSREEYQALKKQIEYWEHETKVAREDIYQSSKETAEKIIDLIKTFCPDKKIVEIITRIISERCGVEIKE